MKKKSLLVLMVSAAMLLTACGGKKKSESSGQSESEPEISETSTSTEESVPTSEPASEPEESLPASEEESEPAESTPAESTPAEESEPAESEPAESTPAESTPAESEPAESEPAMSEEESVPAEVIVHQDPFVTQLENPSTLRDYNKDFDAMVEDFSSNSPTGETTGVFNDPFLRVLVDSDDPGEPTSPDAAIYKMATGVYQLQDYEGIGFTMRVTGGKLNYSNLTLALRGDDAYRVYDLKLSDALDPDQEELPALTDEFQDVIISPQQSIDASTNYELLEGGDSGVGVLDKILGFHLYALNEECSAVVEIKEVFIYNAGEKTSLDTFNRDRVNKTDPSCWWRDSTGFIVRKGVMLSDGATYTTPSLVSYMGYANFVLTILGDTTGTTINGVAWADLKDVEGNAVSNAVNGAFFSLVINPDKSNLELEGGVGTIASTTEIVISAFYMTNMQTEAVVSEYPAFDGNTVSHFDLIGRTSTHIAPTWDEGNSSVDEGVMNDGLNFSISYHNDQYTSVGSGMIKIEGGDYDYVQVTEGTTANYQGYKYLVLGLQATDLSGLRIAMPSGSEPVYAKDWLAGSGLPSIPANMDSYEYNFYEFGVYYIIDLEKSGLTAADSMDIFYTGTENCYIGSIFFANDYEAPLMDQKVLEYQMEPNLGYDWAGLINVPANCRYMEFTLTTATPDWTIDLIRFQGANGVMWFHEGGIIDEDGEVIDGTSLAGSYVIDLVASGLKAEGVAQGIDVHVGNSGNEETAYLSVSLYIPRPEAEIDENLFEATVDAGEDYAWVGGFDVPANVDYLYIETNAVEANEIRFENAGTFAWVKSGEVIDMNGNPVAADAKEYAMDLIASGLKEKNTAAHIDVHSTQGEESFLFAASSYVKVVYGEKSYPEARAENADLSAWSYVGGLSYAGYGRYAYVSVQSKDNTLNPTLKSLRFVNTAGEEKWFKDLVVYDYFGHVVSPDTVIPYEDALTIVIDLYASGLAERGEKGTVHMHAGGFDGSEGIVDIAFGMFFLDGSELMGVYHAEMMKHVH
ncbi:MAG: hypothetical protein IJQ67_04810 [Bacilli bacterium]|nr:hypothetical protein [Bacilli bacterium]